MMMMMQVGLTLPPHNLHPTPSRTTRTTSLELKRHLFNLDKLLQLKHSHYIDDHPVEILQHHHPHDESININKGRGLLQGLNLATIWPQMKAVVAAAADHEEMSPRHLNKLQRLLSKSSIEYSPRNILGSRWREYHGSNDWSGLLDPLDENLRREVVRYGEFIQAAYRCFHSDPAMSPDKAPSPRHVTLSDRSYKVTKSLYATSSVGLPKWVDVLAPDLGWMTQRSSWIGYVAVCEDMDEIQRMGRRDIVIALRGTATCLEWGENFRDMLVPLNTGDHHRSDGDDDNNHIGQAPPPPPPPAPKVECGFSSLYKTQGAHVASLSQSVVDEVQRLIGKYKGETLSITVTGHSLGAALALLVADEVSTCAPDAPPVAVFSFGGPRVGNRGFADQLKNNNVKVLRVVNNQDVITRVPGVFVSEELDKKVRNWGGGGEKVLNLLDNKMPWAYTHVGIELRVDTKSSPYLKPNADVACCHDLEAYLHLVDGFLATNCPFRSNAKRSLWRLLNEQKSNMKMLYTSKAKGLTLNIIDHHNQKQQQQQLINNNHHLSVMSSGNALPSPS